MFAALITPPSPLFKSARAPTLISSSARAPPTTTRVPITCASTCHAPPSIPRQLGDLRNPAASLYEVLQVSQNASAMQIKTAYRTLAKLYHPDSTSQEESDGRDFIEIHNAYAMLSDPSARAMYDLSLGRMQRRRTARSDVYATRRWETDQCW